VTVGGTVISSTITIGGSASDAPSGVQKIEFFADGALIASAFEPSFTASYNTNLLSEGPHAFTARAIDRAGNVGPLGSAVTAVVDNKQITVVITKAGGDQPAVRGQRARDGGPPPSRSSRWTSPCRRVGRHI
jgi:hypothetical protein